MYLICHVTQQDLSVEMSCVFMGKSSSPHVTNLKSLVTIDNLIVMRKNSSSKASYKWYILRSALKSAYVTTFHNVTLKMETS